MSCPDCFRGGKATGDPKGTVEPLHGVPTYIAGPPPTNSSGSTIVYFCDAFGLGLVNNKLLADAYAAGTGHRVIAPDIIPGGPVSTSMLTTMDTVMQPVPFWNLWGWAVRAWNLVRTLSMGLPMMLRAAPKKKVCYDACHVYVDKVRAELPPGAKLGVAGFCWGGYQAVNLCAETVTGRQEPLVHAAFAAHPSQLAMPDDLVKAVMTQKTPVSIAHAEQDFALPNKQMLEAEALLKDKSGNGEGEGGYHWQIKYYEGVPHGFAVRAREGYEKEAAAADAAKQQAIDWFKQWL